MDYHPTKYYRGLSKTRKAQRKHEIAKFGRLSWKNPRAYVGFKTDKGVKTKTSSYTEQWVSRFPTAKSLEEKAKVTGVPLSLIRQSYNRGLAAWRTGHRPGATQQQWGYARVHSMLLCGKTAVSTDADLVREAKKTKSGAHWYSASKC